MPQNNPKQFYSDEECQSIEFDANMLSTELERIDPENIESRSEAQSTFDNLLMGLYNLADKMGVKYD